MIEKASMPAALFPALEQQGTLAGQVALLARHFGVLLGKGSERIATEPASREVSESLGVAEGTIVVVMDRVILALDRPGAPSNGGSGGAILPASTITPRSPDRPSSGQWP